MGEQLFRMCRKLDGVNQEQPSNQHRALHMGPKLPEPSILQEKPEDRF